MVRINLLSEKICSKVLKKEAVTVAPCFGYRYRRRSFVSGVIQTGYDALVMMRPDRRSISFTWQAGNQNVQDGIGNHNVRRKIQDSFDNEQSTMAPFRNGRSLLRSIGNFTFPSVGVQPRQAIREGAGKLTKTLRDVRTSFDTLSQKLRRSTRRRIPLRNEHSPHSASTTPRSRTRQLLGRTPTKLYSPFDIESPARSVPSSNTAENPPSLRKTPMKQRQCQYNCARLRNCGCKPSIITKEKVFSPVRY